MAPEVPIAPKKRKDSLAQLIGAAPMGAKGLDSAETVEDAMLAKYVFDLGLEYYCSVSSLPTPLHTVEWIPPRLDYLYILETCSKAQSIRLLYSETKGKSVAVEEKQKLGISVCTLSANCPPHRRLTAHSSTLTSRLSYLRRIEPFHSNTRSVYHPPRAHFPTPVS